MSWLFTEQKPVFTDHVQKSWFKNVFWNNIIFSTIKNTHQTYGKWKTNKLTNNNNNNKIPWLFTDQKPVFTDHEQKSWFKHVFLNNTTFSTIKKILIKPTVSEKQTNKQQQQQQQQQNSLTFHRLWGELRISLTWCKIPLFFPSLEKNMFFPLTFPWLWQPWCVTWLCHVYAWILFHYWQLLCSCFFARKNVTRFKWFEMETTPFSLG